MSLFQESIIRKHLGYLDQEVIDQAYIRFKEVYSANKIANIKIAKEEQYQEGFIKDIFGTVLGYSVFPEQPFNIQTEKKNVADSKKADGAIFQGEDVVGVIELKDNKTKNLDAVKDQAFGYKNNHKECSYVISSNFHKLRFYVDDATEYEEFDLYNLDKETFKRFYLYLRKEGLLDKNIPKLLRQETKFHEENITKSLYKDYSSFKNTFFQNVVKNNPQFDKLILFKKSQKFLDKVLFVLFAEDKGLVTTNSIVQIIEKWQDLKNDAFDTPKPLYHLVSLFFNNLFVGKKDQNGLMLIPEFGGEIFAPDDVLDNLIIDDSVLKDDLLKLSRYDFNTDVDVNILGHIFEHSLSEIEEVEAELKGEVADKTKGKRKKDGVFYTPKYITKYIVENTIGKLCSEKKIELKLDIDIAIFDYQKPDGKLNPKGVVLFESLNRYKDWLLTLKILDPACGSGAFLNQAVNFLVQEHQFIDDIIAELTNTPLRLFDTDIAILENNIYGVDINEESIEIAKLSLWLRTAKQGRKLSNLSNNIKCGNSLIDDPAVAGNKAFNWQKEFPDIFNNGGFDVVIGNPPYVNARNMQSKERDYLTIKYPQLSGAWDLYVPFLLKVEEISKNNCYGWIIPNKLLISEYAKSSLIYLKQKGLNKIINISSLPIFENVGVYPIILINNNENNNFTIYEINNVQNFSNIENYIKKDNVFKRYKTLKENNILINSGTTGFEAQKIIPLINENNEGINFAVSGSIDPYKINFSNVPYMKKKYQYPKIRLDETIVSGSKIDFWNKEKVIIAGMTKRLEAYYSINPLALGVGIYGIYGFGKFDPLFLLSILNSKFLTFYLITEFKDKHLAGGYLAINKSTIEELPLVEISIIDQQPFIEKANLMLNLNLNLQEQSQKFHRSLERKFTLTEISKKLQDWYLLSYAEFIKELEKKKVKLTLSEEAEWETYFSTEAKKTLELKSQIEKTDKEIDQMVYTLYELSDDEIKIVEES